MAQDTAEIIPLNPVAPAPVLLRRHVLAATVGNALEFYDFVTYTFFSIQIGHAFFPAHTAFMSLMLSLATFGVGFVTRPIGAIVIGSFADKVGRRSAMMLSFTMMGSAIVLLALIPPYAKIGLAAPILAVIARMLQGFSLGGEVGPNTAYLMEASANNRRGLMVSWQGASQNIAVVTGGLVGVALSALLPHAAVEAYGWRIAFLLGAATLPFGLLLRRTMPETLHAADTSPAPPAVSDHKGGPVRGSVRIIALAAAVLGGGTITTYLFSYMTTFAQNSLNLHGWVVFAASSVPSAAAVVSVLIGGWLSDRVGRRPVMILPHILYVTSILPVFFWIVTARSPLALLGGMALLGGFSAFGQGAFYAALVETLPKSIRGRAFATVYAVSIATFGGTTQLVLTWLIHATGSPMAPAFYALGANLLSLTALLLILESAPVRMSAKLAAEAA
jgi:MHS family citrate/tricarballylate:H+ symporter-like MFS transporter